MAIVGHYRTANLDVKEKCNFPTDGRLWCRAGACHDPTGLDPILHAFFGQRSQRNADLNFSIPYGTLHTWSRIDAVPLTLGNMGSLRCVSPLAHFRTQEDNDDYHYRFCRLQDSGAYTG